MNLQHILVPIDFSPDAELAFDNALDLAQQYQARLTLLHAIDIPTTVEVDLSTFITKAEGGATEAMATYTKRIQEAGLIGDVIVVRGVPYREIVNTAKAKNVDLILMGTHGRTGLQHLILGSVAERVVRLAPCAVMVTRRTGNTSTS